MMPERMKGRNIMLGVDDAIHEVLVIVHLGETAEVFVWGIWGEQPGLIP